MDPHLISVDELRAAGALDVPEAWRKSLAQESRYTLPGFGDDDVDSQIDDESTESADDHQRTDHAHAAVPARHSKSNATTSSRRSSIDD